MKTVAIVCQKGGVGKSTTALNLGAGLSFKEKKVLFIDLDAQGNLTETLGGESRRITIFDVLTGNISAENAVQQTSIGDLIAAGPRLAWADMTFLDARREYRLRDAMYSFAATYDYIIIDTPPALGILTVNALSASTDVIITAQADIYSLKSIGQLSMTIDAVRQHSNIAITIGGILLTRHNSRAIVSRDMVKMIEEAAAALHTKVFKSYIREAVAIKESQAMHKDIFTYAPKSGAAQDYKDFVNEYTAGT